MTASALIDPSFGADNAAFLTQNISALIVNIVFLLIAVLGEEVGWHGVALPALQQRRSPQVSSLVLGLFMSILHLPSWLILDTFDQFGSLYPAPNILIILPISFYLTWFFNHSGYSLLLPLVFHLGFNIVNTILMPVTLRLGAFGILILFSWILMILVTPRLAPKRSWGHMP